MQTLVARTTALKRWMTSHPLVGFFGLAFAITWPAWFTLAASSHDLIAIDVPLLFVVGGVGPGVAALVVMRAIHGRQGDTLLGRGLLRWRVPPVWYAAALGLPLIIRLATAAVSDQAGGLTAWAPDSGLVEAFGLYLVRAVPEEVGWRGFALPRLQARCNALIIAAAVVVGFWPRASVTPSPTGRAGLVTGTRSRWRRCVHVDVRTE